jgi:hypothetical protein
MRRLYSLAWYVLSPAILVLGGLLHLTLDLIFNGELTPRSIVPFYSFGYRLRHGF